MERRLRDSGLTFLYIFEPPGSFSTRGAHPEERSDEGSHEILPRFARQDEGSNIRKNSPTPQIFAHSGEYLTINLVSL